MRAVVRRRAARAHAWRVVDVGSGVGVVCRSGCAAVAAAGCAARRMWVSLFTPHGRLRWVARAQITNCATGAHDVVAESNGGQVFFATPSNVFAINVSTQVGTCVGDLTGIVTQWTGVSGSPAIGRMDIDEVNGVRRNSAPPCPCPCGGVCGALVVWGGGGRGSEIATPSAGHLLRRVNRQHRQQGGAGGWRRNSRRV